MILFRRDENGEPEKIEGLPPEDWRPTSDEPLIPEDQREGLDFERVLDSIEDDIEDGKLDEEPIYLDVLVTSGQRDDLRKEFYKRRDRSKYILRSSKVQNAEKARLGVDDERDLFELRVNLRSRSDWDDPFSTEDSEEEKSFEEIFDELE